MFRKIIALLAFIGFYTSYSQSNKTIYKQGQFWFTYNLNWKINDSYSSVTEVYSRVFLDPVERNQLGGRISLRKKLTKNWFVGGGGAFFLNSPGIPSPTNKLVVPEIRPQVEVNYNHKLGASAFTHRGMVEARFLHAQDGKELGNGYHFNNFRFRYQLSCSLPLISAKEKNSLALRLQDEVMINATSKKTVTIFDQNRISVGLNYSILKNVSVEVGYMKIHRQQNNSDNFFDSNVLRFTIFHRIE